MSSSSERLELRRRLSERSRRFTQDELALSGSRFSELGTGAVIEFAHTPHFGHLGFFRMLVHAVDAARASQATLLLIFNDNVRANALPTIRQIPMQRGGIDLEHSPALGIAKADRTRPLRHIPAPGPENLRKAREGLENILLFERSAHPGAPSKAALLARTSALFDSLSESAAAVSNFANWTIRSLLLLLESSDLAGTPICVVRSSDLVAAMPRQFQQALARREPLAGLINSAHAETNPEWPEWSRPHMAGEGFFPAWVLCDHCRQATDDVTIETDTVHVRCRKHEWSEQLSPLSEASRLSPKVVLRQPLANLLGLESRICGNRLGYWQVADEFSALLTGHDPPPRCSVTGRVSFESGLAPVAGAPPLLRVLAELPASDLVSQLKGSPGDDMTVHVPPSGEHSEPPGQAPP